MPSEKLPHIQFYPGDWRTDVAVQSLSYHHRGIWIEILMLMFVSEDRGRLVSKGKPLTIAGVARLLGMAERDAEQAIQVLLESGVASRDKTGALYNRRMVRDEEIRRARAAAGQKGGLSKTQANGQAKLKQNPDIDNDNDSSSGKRRASNLEEVSGFCKQIGLRRADAEWFWHKCEGNGWINGGHAIKDWRQTLRSWKAGGYVPSIKNPPPGVRSPSRVEPVKKKPDPNPLPPPDPIKQAEFQKRLSAWKDAGRPLGEFPQ